MIPFFYSHIIFIPKKHLNLYSESTPTTMKYTLRILILITLSALSLSVLAKKDIQGNKNVKTQTITVDSEFKGIHVSDGISLIINQSETPSIKAEMDANLHEYLKVEIIDQVLHISFIEKIGKRKASNVYIEFENIKSLSVDKEADITNSTLIWCLSNITLAADTEGSMNLNLKAEKIILTSKDNSEIELKGTCDFLKADCNTGSSLVANELITLKADLVASEESDISVYVRESIKAKANVDSNIECIGEPIDKEIDPLSVGTIFIK